MQDPTSRDENGLVSLRDHVDFVSHCADCYPKLTATLPDDLINLLTTHHAVLETELRDKLVGSLVLLRNKDVIDSPRYGLLVMHCERWLISEQFAQHSLSHPRFHSQQDLPQPALLEDPF